MAIYQAPVWVNDESPAINASRLQKLCDAVEQDGVDIQTMQYQMANPYTFKGSVAKTSNLPSTGNTVNDTYYVTDKQCMYTWNGTSWKQSSVSGLDYAAELTALSDKLSTAVLVDENGYFYVESED